MILLPTSKIKSRRKSRKVDWTWSWRRSLVDDLYSFSIIFLFAMFRFHVSLLSNCNDGYFLFKMMSSILRQRDMNFLTSIGTLCTDWHHLTLQKQTSCFQVIDPCCCFFPMHHGHSSLIFPPTIWCLFFFWPIDWSSREPMGSNCAFVRASESPEIDDLFVVEKKKTPTFKSRNPWLSVTFHLFPLGKLSRMDVTQGCSWQDGLCSSGAVSTSAICFWCKCGLEA